MYLLKSFFNGKCFPQRGLPAIICRTPLCALPFFNLRKVFETTACSYARMYKDVRAAVDLCHRDGTLKHMVAKDPQR